MAAGVGKVTSLHGVAQVQRAGNTTTSLTQGGDIAQDDVITTRGDSQLEITFADDTRFTLGADSRITIDEFVYDPASKQGKSDIRIGEGFFRFVTGQMAHEDMVYTTPTSVIGIRGSEAFGEVRPDGATLLGLTECCVDLKTKGGTVLLDKPNTFTAAFSAFSPPTPPAPCTGAWLQKTGRKLGAKPGDPLYGFAQTPSQIITMGIPSLDLRYRYDTIEQGALNDATASTLRARLGYQTATYKGFNAYGELEQVIGLGAEDYNNGTNGRTSQPLIADDTSSKLSALNIAYEGEFATHWRLGRQRIAYDNHRFIGTADFRQSAQSFDALSITDFHLPGITANYAYVPRVNRVFPDDSPFSNYESDSHFFNIAYDRLSGGRLSAYAYLLDLEEAPLLSSQSYGLRYAGQSPLPASDIRLLYTLEYAQQWEYAENPADYRENYWHVNGGVAYHGVEALLGFESLGGNGSTAFQTPLGSPHPFNGLADNFTAIPATGLEDVYAQLGYSPTNSSPWLQGINLTFAHHWFSAETGNADYGTEWDISVRKPLFTHYTIGLEYADYEAEDFGVDTQAFRFTVGARF